MSSTKGAWKLQEVRDKILSGEWVQYDTSNDPGTLWIWGNGSYGQLGDGTNCNSRRSSPVQLPGTTWNKFCAKSNITATKSDGTLWTWGKTGNGVHGDNTNFHRSVPVQVPGNAWNNIGNGNNLTLATKTDGTLWAWGTNNYGQLGDSTVVCRSSPIQIPGTAWSILGPTEVTAAAIKTDGTLWTWGSSNLGRLGNNTSGAYSCKSSPIQIPGTTWSDIRGGGSHFLARKTDGTLWAWGYNRQGQLGNNCADIYNPFASQSSPIQVPGNTWNDIDAGPGQSLARKTDGTLWAWGNNECGRLGVIGSQHRSSPTQVPGTLWNDMSGGYKNSLGRKTDGTLWVWGVNCQGQLGQNSQGYGYCGFPIQIPGVQWNGVSSGSADTMMARKA